MKKHARWFALAVMVISQACEHPNDPGSKNKEVPGSILVSISTVGDRLDFDPDGYSLKLDSETDRLVAATGTVTFLSVVKGSHTVRIDGLAPNCSVTGSTTELSVAVSEGARSIARFTVTCTPNTGTLQLTISTTGNDPDVDGYRMDLPEVLRTISIPSNGSQTITDVRAGKWSLRLDGVSANCSGDALVQRLVDVPFHGMSDVTFNVQCVSSGSLQITAGVHGVDLDPSGFYSISSHLIGSPFSSSAVVPQSSTATVSALIPGTYLLSFLHLQPNCNPDFESPLSVTVGAGNPTPVTLAATCTAATRIAFVSGTGSAADIYVINSNGGTAFRLTSEAGFDGDPSWSPDGTRIAFTSERPGKPGVYVMNTNGTDKSALTEPSSANYHPAWSPDGSRIAFTSERDGNAEIYVMNADGSNGMRLTNRAGRDTNPAWSPDGRRIAFQSSAAGIGGVWTMNADGSEATQVASVHSDGGQPTWSPDGKRIAFTRESSSANGDLFIVNADGSGLARLTTGLDSALDPAWSPDGKTIALSALSAGCFDFYSYDVCEPYVLFVRLDGVTTLRLDAGYPASNPAWRP